MARITRVWMVLAVTSVAVGPAVCRAADHGYQGTGYTGQRQPCRQTTPYYDHGPNWGENPATRHPVYAIDPDCGR